MFSRMLEAMRRIAEIRPVFSPDDIELSLHGWAAPEGLPNRPGVR
jgi:hypothetical protein